MPWNDTAQIDFLNPEAREAVIRTIVGVCQQFSIVRFDAAMTLAKRHIQRLWYPAPGSGGAIASRAEHSITTEEFNRRIPNEFWREVVDRCAAEAPNTLLLAEAFWMMEGYFVRTLGMHRVYNSAFMNMLKNEENSKYRSTIKNTMEFDPEILKRFVNFMNNPDEETAVAQFGKGDKYFGICTLLVTMPGLPMFGHGQIEGFEEKYGMEYRRSYRDEIPDGYMVDRHEREIFPLMKRRALFSGSANFRIYDLYCNGSVNENVFAYSNRAWINGHNERTLIFYNNSYYETSGWIKVSDPAIPCEGGTRRDSLSEALAIHGESQYFTLLREQKSNLWYIRSSKAICENGFFVGLQGYETQVFLDVYEVEDNAKGRWARLNNDLNGKGVADPQTAIKDIFLGELYYRFMEILKPEIIINMNDSLDKESYADSFKDSLDAFINTAVHFISGANGAYDEWTAKNKNGSKINFTAVNKEIIEEEFKEFINRLKKLKAALQESAVGKSESPLFTRITQCNTKGQRLYSVALSYGLLSLLRLIIGKEADGTHAASLAFDHWDLGRKMREIYRRFGASEAEAWRITDVARAVLGRTSLSSWSNKAAPFREEGTKFDAADFAALVIQENYQNEDFRRILGINFFNDVAWFNKEGFEDALFYSSVFFMVESDNIVKIPIDERIDRIAKIYEVLIKAEEKAEYRFDNLIEILTSKLSKAKIIAGKAITATKKTEIKAKVEEKTEVKKTEPKMETKVKTVAKKVEPKTEAKVETVAKKVEPKTEAKVETVAKKVVPKAKATAKKTEVKAKTATKKPETKLKAKSAVKKTEPKVKTKTVTKKTEPKVKAKTVVKKATTKTVKPKAKTSKKKK
ncbi:alpha-amylase [Treponema sp. R8-4-B8]